MTESVSEAIALWGWRGARGTLISRRENAVYRIIAPDGRKAALRIHRMGYNTQGEIRSELWWAGELARVGIPTPRPIRRPDGTLVARLRSGRLASMVSWLEGRPLGSGSQPLSYPESRRQDLYRALGRLLARLHRASDEMTLPHDFTRRRWNAAGLLGDNPLWGRFWDHPALERADRADILAARDSAARVLSGLDTTVGNGDFGLIHADALRENVMLTDTGLALIDLDDSGFGWRLFDLAVALSQSIDDDDYMALRDAILQGYGEVRNPPAQGAEMFVLFAMLRCFASLGWCMSRMPPGSTASKVYVARAIRMARHWLQQDM